MATGPIDLEAVRLEGLMWSPTEHLRWHHTLVDGAPRSKLEQLWERVTGEKSWRPVGMFFDNALVEFQTESPVAKSGPAPFTPAIVAKTILAFLGVDPNETYPCEHGCHHPAGEYVEAQLEQMLRHAHDEGHST